MFWNRFFDECNKKGTSPNAVCKEIGLSNATATGWKNGTLPKADVLVKLAKHLDVSVDYLLGVKNEKPLEPIALRASVSEWTELLNSLSDENLIKLRDYAQLLILQQHSQAEKEDQGSQK
jgi:transcriptional regulator with XRE-family HTH domain